MKRFIIFLASALALLAVSCTPKEKEIAVTAVSINPSTLTLEEGGSAVLTAYIEPSDATNKNVNWSSSNFDVAAVNDGTVRALAAGTATITATAEGGKTATCEVTVLKSKIPVKSVTLSESSLTLVVGDVESLTATVLPADATEKGVLWSSSAENVATVSQAGEITAVAPGSADIVVTTVDGGLTAKCALTVEPPFIHVESVSVEPESVGLVEGETAQLAAKVLPEDASDPSVQWSSADEAIVTVDETGLITAVAVGETTVSATTVDGGLVAECAVKVDAKYIAVTGIVLSSTSCEVMVGDTYTIEAKTSPEDATNPVVTWTSEAPEFATVDDKGVVTALKLGEARIVAQAADDSEVKASCEIKIVRRPVESISLGESSITLEVSGKSEPIPFTVEPENASISAPEDITVKSSDNNVATASRDGNAIVVLGVGPGSAVITVAAVDGPSAALEVTVKAPVETPEAVDLGLPSGTLWASYNVGAAAPSEFGSYYSFGEIEPKDKYFTSDYLKGDIYGSSTLRSLKPEDDVAAVMYGGKWHIPAAAQVAELRDYCTWTWETLDGAPGQRIAGPNGNSIFLPAAGFARDAKIGEDSGSWGDYATDDIDKWPFNFSASGFGAFKGWSALYTGVSVRAVYSDPFVHVTKLSLNLSSIDAVPGTAVQLVATIEPANATYRYVTWSSNNEDVATVSEDGLVSILKSGYAAITASLADGTYAQCFVLPVFDWNAPAKVDLGLPSGALWASCNLGASKPEDTGAWFAFGETEPKAPGAFQRSSYKWYADGSYTKYAKTYYDNLEASDDAAAKILGDKWRVPTTYEITELITECTKESVTVGSVNAVKFTGPNGNSIILPVSGGCDPGLNHVGNYGFYMSRRPGTTLSIDGFSYAELSSYMYSYEGVSIRPVYAEPYFQEESISIDKTRLEAVPGTMVQLHVTFTPSNTSIQKLTWQSDDESVATVSENGVVSILKEGLAVITATSFATGAKVYCEIMPSYTWKASETIDLGLPSGTIWASCNLGAASMEQPGAYFAWGETEPKAWFGWDNYKFTTDYGNTFTKYVIDSYYGTVDGKTGLDLEDDAAHVNLGGGWRMPTSAEQQELLESCDWTDDLFHGQPVLRGVSKYNGEIILFPKSSLRYNGLVDEAFLFAWSNSLGVSEYKGSGAGDKEAQYMIIEESMTQYVWSYYRYVGVPIRPVIRSSSSGAPKKATAAKAPVRNNKGVNAPSAHSAVRPVVTGAPVLRNRYEPVISKKVKPIASAAPSRRTNGNY